jgi:hypothetical protein
MSCWGFEIAIVKTVKCCACDGTFGSTGVLVIAGMSTRRFCCLYYRETVSASGLYKWNFLNNVWFIAKSKISIFLTSFFCSKG